MRAISQVNSNFKDHFSGHAGSYAAHRPGYPESLFTFLASCSPGRKLAWDCATGNGQAACSLANYFDNVTATDASAEQIASAVHQGGVEFRVATAEASGLRSGSVDLITVAQALHWFDIDRFFAEAVRVLRPAGVLSVWCYERCRVNSRCNEIIEAVFAEVEPYWPPERAIVEKSYQGITLPVAEFPADEFSMRATWAAEDMLGYMRTWSASQRYIEDQGADPTLPFAADLISAWGGKRRTVRWPITLRAGRK